METQEKLPEGEAPKQSESEVSFEDLHITMANVAELDERLEAVERKIELFVLNEKIKTFISSIKKIKAKKEEEEETISEEKPCGCHEKEISQSIMIEELYEDLQGKKQRRAEISESISNFIVNVAFGAICVCLGVELAKKFPKWFK